MKEKKPVRTSRYSHISDSYVYVKNKFGHINNNNRLNADRIENLQLDLQVYSIYFLTKLPKHFNGKEYFQQMGVEQLGN